MQAAQSGLNERTWSMLCHLASLSLFLGIPFGHIIGPLIIWLIKKDQSAAVDAHGKESLNFQLSLTLYAVVSVAAVFGLVFLLIGIVLRPLLPVFLLALIVIQVVCVILAAIKANNGESYHYPFTICFL